MGAMSQENQTVADDKRDRLLAAAERLFCEHGFHQTQVADIAKAAGTGISTFYRNFADKEEVMKVMLRELFDGMHDRFIALRRGIEHRTPLEQFAMVRATFALVLESLVKRPALLVALFRAGFIDAEIEGLTRAFLGEFVQDLVDDLRRAEAAGLVEMPNGEVLATGLAGLALQIAHRMVIEQKPGLEQAVDACTRFTLGGLLAFAPDAAFNELMPIYRMLLRPAGAAGL